MALVRGKWTVVENVELTHLVLVSGKPALQKVHIEPLFEMTLHQTFL